MHKQELAILFSGGTDSLALYALATAGHHPDMPRPRRLHLLNMLNGMGRFPDFTRNRYEVARALLARRVPDSMEIPDSYLVELDMGRLFQGLWLDRYEEFMPRYGGKNLVCVACKLAMHIRAVLYCNEHLIPTVVAGYTKKQSHYPEQTPVFMEKIAKFSARFGVAARYPVYDDFAEQMTTRHLLEDFGLPSTGGGERKCLFSQTLATATEKEIGLYLDDMIPRAQDYIECVQDGRIADAARCFPPGNLVK
ncbi:MAG: hypothetical protein BM485_15235 [Desulfobulbaceae bacterium DB1]|nr:MAG: hypothetical protein BM485_15235 [Desulfobulbaceae bacterium DB1]